MNRREFFHNIADRLSAEELVYVQRAYWLVKDAHRLQSRRLTGERYFEHVRRVACHAIDFGYCDGETIALGLLHDTTEDTYVPQDVLVNLFGQTMYEWVLALSKEFPTFHPVTGSMIGRVKLDTPNYYGRLRVAHVKPRIVKGCDRIDNLQDLVQFEPPRKTRYIQETREFVLPLVERTDIRIAAEINRRLGVA